MTPLDPTPGPAVSRPPQADPFRFSVGAASPLWAIYAGAAGAGVAYWWATRWMRPVNLEAWWGAARSARAAEPQAAPRVKIEPLPPVAVGGESAPLAGAPPAAVAEAVKAVSETVGPVAETVAKSVEAAPMVEAPRAAAPAPPAEKASSPVARTGEPDLEAAKQLLKSEPPRPKPKPKT